MALNNNGKESGGDLSKNLSKESIFSAASDHKSVGTTPSPKLVPKHESRKSLSAPVTGGGQEKNVIQAVKNVNINFFERNKFYL